MGFLLLILSLILYPPLTVLNIILVLNQKFSFKRLDGYFFQTAVDIDRFGNRNLRTLWDATLIKDSPYRFGDPRETISSVLGKNQEIDTLTNTGKLLVKLLDWLDPDHCRKAIVWYHESSRIHEVLKQMK